MVQGDRSSIHALFPELRALVVPEVSEVLAGTVETAEPEPLLEPLRSEEAEMAVPEEKEETVAMVVPDSPEVL